MNSFSKICLNDDLNEFLPNPTSLSQHLRDIVCFLYRERESQFTSRSFIKRMYSVIELQSYLKLTHTNLLANLKKIDFHLSVPNSVWTLESLLAEFTLIQRKLILNNFALSYFYLQNTKKIETKTFRAPYLLEEESKTLLKDFADGKVTREEFILKFGHFSLNNYEIAEKRFSEYSRKELQQIGNLMIGMIQRRLDRNSDYFQQFCNNPISDQEIYSNLLLIRDFSKYISVKIIAMLRERVMVVSKKQKVMNPFKYKWDELVTILEQQ